MFFQYPSGAALAGGAQKNMYYGNHRHCNQSLKEGKNEVRKGVIQLGFEPIGSFLKPMDDFL